MSTSLTIAYKRAGDDRNWSWRVVKDQKSMGYRIELGIGDADNDAKFDVKATYQWSLAKNDYAGPAGGPEEGFYRVKNRNLFSRTRRSLTRN